MRLTLKMGRNQRECLFIFDISLNLRSCDITRPTERSFASAIVHTFPFLQKSLEMSVSGGDYRGFVLRPVIKAVEKKHRRIEFHRFTLGVRQPVSAQNIRNIPEPPARYC